MYIEPGLLEKNPFFYIFTNEIPQKDELLNTNPHCKEKKSNKVNIFLMNLNNTSKNYLKCVQENDFELPWTEKYPLKIL